MIKVLTIATLLLIAGCGQDRMTMMKGDPVQTAQALEAAGFSGEITLVIGPGHVGGQAYNLTGVTGYMRIVIDPGKAATVASVHEALSGMTD